MIVVTLARRPLSESNVAANVLAHGCGALAIDASRICGAPRTTHKDGNWTAGKEASEAQSMWSRETGGGLKPVRAEVPSGRWPPNVILGHLPGCTHLGSRRVKATSIFGTSTAIRRSGVHSEAGGHQAVGREQPVRGHADADGLETVDAWDCVEGCPVADLDAQTVPSKSSGGRIGNKDVGGIYGDSKGLSDDFATVDHGTGDFGGPSRYFHILRPGG